MLLLKEGKYQFQFSLTSLSAVWQNMLWIVYVQISTCLTLYSFIVLQRNRILEIQSNFCLQVASSPSFSLSPEFKEVFIK